MVRPCSDVARKAGSDVAACAGCVVACVSGMAVYHDEVEIEDFEYDEDTEMYYYPCPCGDKFAISKVGMTRDCDAGRGLDLYMLGGSSFYHVFSITCSMHRSVGTYEPRSVFGHSQKADPCHLGLIASGVSETGCQKRRCWLCKGQP